MTSEQITLLAKYHIKLFKKELVSDDPLKKINKRNYLKHLNIWESIYWKYGKDLNEEEKAEIKEVIQAHIANSKTSI